VWTRLCITSTCCWHGSHLIDAFGIQQSRLTSRRILGNLERHSSSVADVTADNDMRNALLAVAVKAAKRAGEIIVSHDKGAAVVNHKLNSRDLLTIVDPLCEKVGGIWLAELMHLLLRQSMCLVVKAYQRNHSRRISYPSVSW
jgi:hypothetical protein